VAELGSDKPSIEVLWEHYGARILFHASNGWTKAHCPLHVDMTASAQVNLDENLWNCFSCGRTGDSYTLVELMEPEVAKRGFREVKQRAQELDGGRNYDLSGTTQGSQRGRSPGYLSKKPGPRRKPVPYIPHRGYL